MTAGTISSPITSTWATTMMATWPGRAAKPRNQAWLALCDPCQVPLAREKSWAVMEPVYYNP